MILNAIEAINARYSCRAFTGELPSEEMLPVVDKPLIQYIIEEAAASGIEDILVVTNRAKSAMDDYFDYHPELEERLLAAGKTDEINTIRAPADVANIFYVRQKTTRGLGHAIARARRFIGDEPFAVLLGDDIMRSEVPVTRQLIDVAERYGSSCVGVQAVSPEAIASYSSLQVKEIESRIFDVQKLVEKPRPEQIFSNYAILGRYVLSPAIFDMLETIPAGYGGEIQLTDGINELCKNERVLALDFEGRRYDAGSLRGYLEAIIDLGIEHPEVGDWLRSHIINMAAGFADGV
ncbi:putative UTP--glucose-1-phosphate uridylyltransferase YngB [Clostridia bacterium]|nr:putative UTP--glucose-1-phosphate uridylyltransferase YngB [Clostridia bacterium]